jgi:hypothetical protein
MQYFSATFNALNREAAFTWEMLGAGATQIRNANYASDGVYFQAFTSLSTGLERIGKLCLMLDHSIDRDGQFPDCNYMKTQIGHDLVAIYQQSQTIITKHSISMRFLQNLDDDPIHKAILAVLSEFAMGDRYSNIDLLTGGKRRNDPIASWFKRVDQPLFQARVAQKKKEEIERNAAAVAAAIGQYAMVLHHSETGEEITDLEEASRMTGKYAAVAPYRQLYVMQVIRYWSELLCSLQYKAMKGGSQDSPFFNETFALFCNNDTYIKTRKTWGSIR